MLCRNLDDDFDPFDAESPFVKMGYLGRGSFGTVVHAWDKRTNEEVAVKAIRRGAQVDGKVCREVRNHQLLRYDHVVQYKELFLSRTHLCIVMELVHGRDMLDYLVAMRQQGIQTALSERQARWMFWQLVLAVDFCHEMGVVNRDIKLENTVLDLTDPETPKLKLCDFGLSKHRDMDSSPHTIVGTKFYWAPELINHARASGGRKKYDATRTDVWCLGIFLYYMVTGTYAFYGASGEDHSEAAIFARICRSEREGGPDYVRPEGVSAECLDLLGRILVGNHGKRITIPQIMAHPWFTRDMLPGLLEYHRDCILSGQNDISRGLADAAATERILAEARFLPAEDSNPTSRGITSAHSDSTPYWSSGVPPR